MNVIKPVTVDDTVLLSSTVPETDYAVWNSVTAYAINAYCIMTTGVHRIYQCLVANTNFAPNLNTAGTTPKWLDCGPTNQRAMFDSFVNTRTTGTGTLTVVLQGSGFVSGIGLFGLQGSVLNIKISVGGLTVYDITQSLDGTIRADSYSWFWEPWRQKETIVVTNLPPYLSPTITITIINGSSGVVACGMCAIGSTRSIGIAQNGTGFGLTDYSGIITDTFGNTTFIKRGNSRLLNLELQFKASELETFDQTMRDLTSIPCVWQATDSDAYQFMTTFGYYPDMIAMVQSGYGTCSLSIRGII